MDVFVFPSLFEGLPLVALEAQASGVCSVMADTISKEVKITDAVTFLPLAHNAKEWKEYILETGKCWENGSSKCYYKGTVSIVLDMIL